MFLSHFLITCIAKRCKYSASTCQKKEPAGFRSSLLRSACIYLLNIPGYSMTHDHYYRVGNGHMVVVKMLVVLVLLLVVVLLRVLEVVLMTRALASKDVRIDGRCLETWLEISGGTLLAGRLVWTSITHLVPKKLCGTRYASQRRRIEHIQTLACGCPSIECRCHTSMVRCFPRSTACIPNLSCNELTIGSTLCMIDVFLFFLLEDSRLVLGSTFLRFPRILRMP